jgi:uncharacterized protein (TIGR00661 family)
MLERKGYELFFFSGGIAYQLLRKDFKNVYPCTPVGWYENAHGIITSASFLNILIPLPCRHDERSKIQIKNSTAMETIHRYYDLRGRIRKIRPDLIISDGDIHALRLAHKWAVPSVYIANIIRPSYDFSPLLIPGERLTERYVKYSSKIIVPDNPPPYTVCEYNLGDLDAIGVMNKVEFVGSFLDMNPVEGSEEYIFAPISGPLGTRATLKQKIFPVLKNLEMKSIIGLGEPVNKYRTRTGNCEIYSWLSAKERQECMRNSEMVIFSGGHITCLETIKYAKPSVCIPTQSEQTGNARKMQDLNCSIIAQNEEQLKSAIKRIEDRKQFYQSHVKMVSNYSSKFKGLENAVAVIEGLVR